MDSLDPLLLHAVGAYEAHHGSGPKVSELATDLGIPADFGHHHLVERLRHELTHERLAHFRGRFTLTAAGRLALEAQDAGASPAAEAAAESALSPRVP